MPEFRAATRVALIYEGHWNEIEIHVQILEVPRLELRDSLQMHERRLKQDFVAYYAWRRMVANGLAQLAAALEQSRIHAQILIGLRMELRVLPQILERRPTQRFVRKCPQRMIVNVLV